MYKLQNYMEILVEQYLMEILAPNTPRNLEMRHSPKMLAEVQVLVLNHIPPFYVTGKEGEVYGFSTAAVSQNKADIMIEITKAIEVTYNKMV